LTSATIKPRPQAFLGQPSSEKVEEHPCWEVDTEGIGTVIASNRLPEILPYLGAVRDRHIAVAMAIEQDNGGIGRALSDKRQGCDACSATTHEQNGLLLRLKLGVEALCKQFELASPPPTAPAGRPPRPRVSAPITRAGRFMALAM
jgi:hypothetical protein